MIRIIVVAAFVLLLCARPAHADSCSISATSIVFGGYNVFASSPTDTTGSVTYECTGGGRQPISIALVPSGGTTPALVRGSERLYCNLFTNAGRTTVWGNGSGGSQEYVAERSKDPVSVPVFGRIPPGQDVAVGGYADTVTVVVNF